MDIFQQLIRYFEFLEREYSLFVSVHCLRPPLNSLICRLGKYNSHYHPFCMHIKGDTRLWEQCLLMQSRVMARGGEDIFTGRCIFGVSEYVIPITSNGESIGFISVSGFAEDGEALRERLRQISSKYSLDLTELEMVSGTLQKTRPDPELVSRALSHIASLLSVYASALPESESGSNKTNYIFSNALAYIHEHYTEQITVEGIAEFCKCSRSYITKLFKANGGKSIKSHITELRMQEAKRLLRDRERSIKEIAFRIGYNDSNYFSNVFFGYTGSYPREYRRRLNIK